MINKKRETKRGWPTGLVTSSTTVRPENLAADSKAQDWRTVNWLASLVSRKNKRCWLSCSFRISSKSLRWGSVIFSGLLDGLHLDMAASRACCCLNTAKWSGERRARYRRVFTCIISVHPGDHYYYRIVLTRPIPKLSWKSSVYSAYLKAWNV